MSNFSPQIIIVFITCIFFIQSPATAITTTYTSSTGGGDWSNASNWDNGVPDSTMDVIIRNNGGYCALTAANSYAKSIYIQSGTYLGVQSKTLHVINGISGPGQLYNANSSVTYCGGDFLIKTVHNNGSGAIYLNGTNQQLHFVGNNSSLGAIYITSGTTTIDSAITCTGGAITISSGATLKTASTSITPGFPITVLGTLTVTKTGTSDDLANQYTGTLTITGGTVLYNGASAQNIGAHTFGSLTINNSSGATLTGNVTVNNNLSGTGSLNPSSYNLSVGGNISISTLSAGSGSSTTTISGSSPALNGYTYKNLTINCSGTATISSNTTVNGTLTLTGGILQLGSNKLIIGSGGSITGYSSSSYIFTNGSGVLEMAASGSGVVFPVGDSYNPITIVDPGGNVFDVSVADGVTESDGATQVADYTVNRTWTITCPGASTTITVIPQWDNTTDLCGTHSDLTQAFVASRDITHTNTWTPGSSSDISGQSNPYTVTSSSIAIAAGDVYNIGVGLGSPSTLPVTYLNFTAAVQDQKVLLNWATASEINNNYFEIERSLTGSNWQSIGKVRGKGNSQQIEKYSFADGLQGILPVDIIYYRLKQVDFNGKTSYSNIQSANFSKTSLSPLSAYPVPAGNVIHVQWITATENNTQVLQLLNLNGEVLFEETFTGAGNMQKQIDLSNFPSGIYYLQLKEANNPAKRLKFSRQ